MLNNLYELVNDLSCNDLKILKNKKHMKNKVIYEMIVTKCDYSFEYIL